MIRLRKNKLFVSVASILTAFALTGCSVTVSDEAKDHGKDAIWVMAETSIAQLKAGGAAAKGVAVVIRDNTDNPKIKKTAKAVAKGDAGEKQRKDLANYVKDLRSEEHTSELQSRFDLVCRLLLEK